MHAKNKTIQGLDSKTVVARANTFGRRFGWLPLRKRVLLDWVDEKLVPRPVPQSRGYRQGVQRIWSTRAYQRVLRLMKLKHQGATRHDGLRLALWLRGVEFPIKDIRDGLSSELSRIRKRLRRNGITYDPRAKPEPAPRTKRTIAKAVSKSTPPLIEYSADALLQLYKMAFFGVTDSGATELVADEFRCSFDLQNVAHPGTEIFSALRACLSDLAGILADPNEISKTLGVGWIEECDNTSIHVAREQYHLLKTMVARREPIHEIGVIKDMIPVLRVTVRTPIWEITIYSVLLRCLRALKA